MSEVRSLKWSAGLHASEGENLFLCRFQRLEAACIRWLMAPSSHHSDLCFCRHMSVTLLPPSFPYMDPCEYIELIQVSHDNPSHKILNLITPAKSLLPWTVTSSQVPGIRTWISLGEDIILPTIPWKLRMDQFGKREGFWSLK